MINLTPIRKLKQGGYYMSVVWVKDRKLVAQVLEVGMEDPNKDVFLIALKWYIFKNCANYHVIKSRSEKFEGKSTMHDRICK
ncbi:hypothetical protein J1N35_045265 [Gossypium stocksii]|uniref:Uncharacterized protein n=1 Tax=Gossypium stocksii TaxID=47602 RepID=A0A9D3UB53_9ROSI|nr:hypothetical protein J1N35_045265 [Gossypium stocksii]